MPVRATASIPSALERLYCPSNPKTKDIYLVCDYHRMQDDVTNRALPLTHTPTNDFPQPDVSTRMRAAHSWWIWGRKYTG